MYSDLEDGKNDSAKRLLTSYFALIHFLHIRIVKDEILEIKDSLVYVGCPCNIDTYMFLCVVG